jgi:hypothetical protein
MSPLNLLLPALLVMANGPQPPKPEGRVEINLRPNVIESIELVEHERDWVYKVGYTLAPDVQLGHFTLDKLSYLVLRYEEYALLPDFSSKADGKHIVFTLSAESSSKDAYVRKITRVKDAKLLTYEVEFGPEVDRETADELRPFFILITHPGIVFKDRDTVKKRWEAYVEVEPVGEGGKTYRYVYQTREKKN